MTSDDFIAWRERLGLSKLQAAKVLDMSPERIGDYERGTKRGAQNRPAPIPKTVELACLAISIMHGREQ